MNFPRRTVVSVLILLPSHLVLSSSMPLLFSVLIIYLHLQYLEHNIDGRCINIWFQRSVCLLYHKNNRKVKKEAMLVGYTAPGKFIVVTRFLYTWELWEKVV